MSGRNFVHTSVEHGKKLYNLRSRSQKEDYDRSMGSQLFERPLYFRQVSICAQTTGSLTHSLIYISFWFDANLGICIVYIEGSQVIISNCYIKVSKSAKIRFDTIKTPDPGYQWESDKLTVRHHKREPRGQPFPSR